MILGTGKWRGCKRRAFTLLEVILFILIFVMIVGFLVPAIAGSLGGEDIRRAASMLERMARTARTETVQSGRATQLVFYPRGLEIRSAVASDDLEAPELGAPTHLWPEGVKATIRPWPSTEWMEPEEWAWVFQPGGLVQPLQVRLESGKYWIESDFSPLTAEVREERFYLP